MSILGMILVGIGLIISLIFGIKLIIIAFQESVVWGLIFLFVPFGNLVYIFTRWQKCKGPFLKSLLAIPFLVIGYWLLYNGQVDAMNQAMMYQ